MSFDQSLHCLHRHLSRLWTADRKPNQLQLLSYNEYDYLKSLEKLDGGQIRNFSEDDAKGTHLSELANEMQVRKASASIMVGKLEKRELIRRFPCKQDARAQHIVLTESGKAALLQEQEVYLQMAEKVETLLDEEEFQALEKTLSKLCQQL